MVPETPDSRRRPGVWERHRARHDNGPTTQVRGTRQLSCRQRPLLWALLSCPANRLTVRYDRHAASVLAFLHLACSLICLRFLQRAEAG